MCDPVSSCKLKIRSLIDDALKSLGLSDTAEYSVEYSAISAYGEFSSNVSFTCSKYTDMDHAELAGQIAGRIQAHPSEFKSVTAADSGYINFTMSPQWLKNAMSEITDTGDHFGHKDQKTSGSAVIITLDDQLAETENTAFFRNESVALALESILKASGYAVQRATPDSFSPAENRKVIICAPLVYWDRGKIPATLSAISEHVAVADCIFTSETQEWSNDLVLLLNGLRPQLPLTLYKDLPAGALYEYAWLCSQLRSFADCPNLSAKKDLPYPESPAERMLCNRILSFPSVITKASADLDPSVIVRYLSDLSSDYRLLRDEMGQTKGLEASKSEKLFWFGYLVRQILHNGISLFCIEPLEYL